MKRSQLLFFHILSTIIALLTIGSFFSFSLFAEIKGSQHFISQVKRVIFYCLPILVITMPSLAISGKRLAGNSKNLLVLSKLKRMKWIAMNGVVLVSIAIYLYYLSNFGEISQTFWIFQTVEIVFGGFNLILIGLNIKSGLVLSKKKKGLEKLK